MKPELQLYLCALWRVYCKLVSCNSNVKGIVSREGDFLLMVWFDSSKLGEGPLFGLKPPVASWVFILNLTSFSGFRKRRLPLSMSMGPWSLKCLSRLSSILPIGPDDDQNFWKMVTRYWQPLANFCGSQRLANTLWAFHSEPEKGLMLARRMILLSGNRG